MYPRNAASPEPIAIGPVIQISDGAVQTAGVTVRIKPIGVAEADGGGTTAYSTDGVVLYTPTQAETNYTSFVLIAKKTNCIPASVTVVTSASNTTGYAGTDQSKILNPTSTVNLSGTTISTSQAVASVAGSVGSISGVTFPSNFGSLSITVGGGVTVATNSDKTGYSLSVAPLTSSQTASAVWDALLSSYAVADSFGARVTRLDSASSGNAVKVTGAGHIASDIHELQPAVINNTHFDVGAIDANALASNAITSAKIASGAITSATFAADSITATALATSAGEEIADKVWDEAIAAHLASGSTGEALNNAGGSGNPWITDLATGYTGTQAGNILNQVKAKTDLITTGTIQSSIPVTAQGQIVGPLYIGDDYLNANGRSFQWTVALPSGFVAATSTCKFGMDHAEGAETGASFLVSGTVVDVGSGNVTLRFDVPRATTGDLVPGYYRWSVEIASAGGNEVTPVAKATTWTDTDTKLS